MTSCHIGRPIVAVVLAGACFAQDANAQAAGDFYRDKQMQVIVRSSPGGSYDLYSRLVATHMMKYIPGNPTFITRYMTAPPAFRPSTSSRMSLRRTARCLRSSATDCPPIRRLAWRMG